VYKHHDDKPYPKSREEVVKEREEGKRIILEENPDVSKDTLEFILSLPFEKKIRKVTELETIHATAEQQEEEMERILKKKIMNKALSPCISVIASLVLTGILCKKYKYTYQVF